MIGHRGVPRGRERTMKREDLLAFVAKVDKLRMEGLSMRDVSLRLGVPITTIYDRLGREAASACEEEGARKGSNSVK